MSILQSWTIDKSTQNSLIYSKMKRSQTVMVRFCGNEKDCILGCLRIKLYQISYKSGDQVINIIVLMFIYCEVLILIKLFSFCHNFYKSADIIQYQLFQMTKNHSGKHSTHFVLTKIDTHCHFSNVSVNFSSLQKSNNTFESIVPRFNIDKNFFTPAFCLEVDQEYYLSQPQFERQKFSEKAANAQQKKTESNIMMFSPQSSYCQVCRTNFEDYSIHTNSVEHLKLSKRSRANYFIKQLCTFMKKQNNKTTTKKHKKIKKEAINQRPIRKSERLAEKKNKKETKLHNFYLKSLNSTLIGMSDIGKPSECKISSVMGVSQAINFRI